MGNIPHSSSNGVLEYGWDEDIMPFILEWTDWKTDEIFYSANPNVNCCIFNKSRFVVDVERLENDPLERRGQGIIYTEFENVKRKGNYDKNVLMSLYHAHISKLQNNLSKSSLLLDCHSYPKHLAIENDICIGFNEDWSKPDNEFLYFSKQYFEKYGYRVDFNYPYSNSISPKMPFEYKSMMIELNKNIYSSIDGFDKIKEAVSNFYDLIIE